MFSLPSTRTSRRKWLIAISFFLMITLLWSIVFREYDPPFTHHVHPLLLSHHQRWVECLENGTKTFADREALFISRFPKTLEKCEMVWNGVGLKEKYGIRIDERTDNKVIDWFSEKIDRVSFETLDSHSMGGNIDQKGITLCHVNLTISLPHIAYEQRLLRNFLRDIVYDNHYVLLLLTSSESVGTISILLANIADTLCVNHYNIK